MADGSLNMHSAWQGSGDWQDTQDSNYEFDSRPEIVPNPDAANALADFLTGPFATQWEELRETCRESMGAPRERMDGRESAAAETIIPAYWEMEKALDSTIALARHRSGAWVPEVGRCLGQFIAQAEVIHKSSQSLTQMVSEYTDGHKDWFKGVYGLGIDAAYTGLVPLFNLVTEARGLIDYALLPAPPADWQSPEFMDIPPIVPWLNKVAEFKGYLEHSVGILKAIDKDVSTMSATQRARSGVAQQTPPLTEQISILGRQCRLALSANEGTRDTRSAETVFSTFLSLAHLSAKFAADAIAGPIRCLKNENATLIQIRQVRGMVETIGKEVSRLGEAAEAVLADPPISEPVAHHNGAAVRQKFATAHSLANKALASAEDALQRERERQAVLHSEVASFGDEDSASTAPPASTIVGTGSGPDYDPLVSITTSVVLPGRDQAGHASTDASAELRDLIKQASTDFREKVTSLVQSCVYAMNRMPEAYRSEVTPELERLRQAAEEAAEIRFPTGSSWKQAQRAARQIHDYATVIGARTCELARASLTLILHHRDDIRRHLANLQGVARRIDTVIQTSASVVSCSDDLMSKLQTLAATNGSGHRFSAPTPFHWESPLANPPTANSTIEYLRKIPLPPAPAKQRRPLMKHNSKVLGHLKQGEQVAFCLTIESDVVANDYAGVLSLGGGTRTIGHYEVTGILTMGSRSRSLPKRFGAMIRSLGRSRTPGTMDAMARRGTIAISYDTDDHYGTYDDVIERELRKLTGKTVLFSSREPSNESELD